MPAGLVLQYILFKEYKNTEKAAVCLTLRCLSLLGWPIFVNDNCGNNENNTCRVCVATCLIQKIKVFEPFILVLSSLEKQ